MAMSRLAIDECLDLDHMGLQQLWEEAVIQWFHWGVHKTAQKDHKNAAKRSGDVHTIWEMEKELDTHKSMASVFHGNGDRCLEHYQRKMQELHGQQKADAERDRLHGQMHKASKAGETHDYTFFKNMGTAHS